MKWKLEIEMNGIPISSSMYDLDAKYNNYSRDSRVWYTTNANSPNPMPSPDDAILVAAL